MRMLRSVRGAALDRRSPLVRGCITGFATFLIIVFGLALVAGNIFAFLVLFGFAFSILVGVIAKTIWEMSGL